jgi:hypothetical protein
MRSDGQSANRIANRAAEFGVIASYVPRFEGLKDA